MQLAPSAAVEYSWVLGILGAVTLIYSALIALQQTNLRRLLAYAGISHTGLVIIGIASLNMQGLQGAIFQLLNFTMVAGSLMLVAGFIQHRLGSTEAIHLGGLAKVMPRLSCFYFLFALSSIGLPGTSGFPAELLLIISTMLAHPGISIAALVGVVLSAAYMLSFTRRAFFGPVTRINVKQAQDLRPRELTLLSASALLILAFGLLPNSVLKTNRVAAEAWLSRLLNQPVLASNAETSRKMHGKLFDEIPFIII
jgi:NADH-quinone oxidoreductase subunit M